MCHNILFLSRQFFRIFSSFLPLLPDYIKFGVLLPVRQQIKQVGVTFHYYRQFRYTAIFNFYTKVLLLVLFKYHLLFAPLNFIGKFAMRMNVETKI